MTDWQIHNAQEELRRRQKRGGNVSPIGRLADGMMPGKDWLDFDPEADEMEDQEARQFNIIGLDEFDYEHLNLTPDLAIQLERGIDTARAWLADCERVKGLSFVITGGTGTGKTTIAENLRRVYDLFDVVGGDEADQEYIAKIEGLVARGEMTPEYAAELTSGIIQEVIRVPGGILIEAGELIKIIAEPISMRTKFDQYQVICVDDVGTEVIDYTNERTFGVNRQKLYGRFLNYCYRRDKHLIITSEVPLLMGSGDDLAFNSEFVDIFGSKAFSRLQAKSRGYMVELSGLPDYREVQALRALKAARGAHNG